MELTRPTQLGVQTPDSAKFLRRLRLVLLLSVLAVTLVIGYQRLANRGVANDVQTRAQTARVVVANLVDNAVFKTLENLVAKTDSLHQTAMNFQTQPTPEHLEATVDAWRQSLGAWNLSAAFQYGPATQYDYHKRLASWPCDTVLIEHTMGMAKAGQLQLDSRFLREQRFASLRGLHTIQYLLFREGKPREASSFTPVELTYLTSATKALFEESVDFEAAWRGTENLAPQKLAVIKAAGIPVRPGYADEFKNPGLAGSRYASLATPLQEVFQDISGSIEDITLAIEALPEVMDAQTPAYWQSLDPCEDLLNQLRSIENTYLGGIDGFRNRAVSEMVAVHDKSLDRLIKISLAHTAHRIAVIRDAKDQSPQDQELLIRVAHGELQKLMSRMFAAIPLVILDPAVEPFAAYR